MILIGLAIVNMQNLTKSDAKQTLTSRWVQCPNTITIYSGQCLIATVSNVIMWVMKMKIWFMAIMILNHVIL